MKNGITGADYFHDVDWSKTRAYAVGLGGIFIHKKGRESRGIVQPDEVQAIKDEIISKLSGLKDPKSGTVAVRAVYDTSKIYKGLYTHAAPDLIVGFEEGYRVSWESVTGKLHNDILYDNTKAWSGDHTMDPEIVPGIFFCNRKIEEKDPGLIDMAPTVFALFDIKIPAYMEGKRLL
jgi:predicted AlkP superfamily phosphohydrolase/phosphomutase